MDTIAGMPACECGKCNIVSFDLISKEVVVEPGQPYRFLNSSDIIGDRINEFITVKKFARECLVREGQIDG